MCGTLLEARVQDHQFQAAGPCRSLPSVLPSPRRLPSPGDGNEAIGALIQNYIREIEELR